MKNEKKKFVAEANSFLLFYEEHIRLDRSSCVSSRRIEEAYINYCRLNGYDVVGSNVWSKILQKQAGVEKINIRKEYELGEGDSYNCRGYRGLQLVGILHS